jgi:mannosyltransferase
MRREETRLPGDLVSTSSLVSLGGFAAGLLVLVALASALRLHALGARPIWFDEGVSLGMARLPWDVFLSNAWNAALSNQVFYYIVLRPWLAVAGDSEAALRGLSALASSLSVLAVGLLGRRLFGAWPGLVAAGLLAVQWFSVRYAQEARGYSLATLLVCAAAVHLARHVDEGRRRDLAAWAAASVLAVYAHFFALFVVAAQLVSLVAFGPRELARRRGLVLGAIATVLLLMPVLAALAGGSPSLIRWIPPVDVERVWMQARHLSGGGPWLTGVYAAAFVVVAATALRARDLRRRWALAFALSWALLPLLAMALVSLHVPVLLNRYLVMSIPGWPLALAALLSCGGESLVRRLAATSVAVLAIGAAAANTTTAWRDAVEDWKAPADAVAAQARAGDVIVYESSWSGETFGYYLNRHALRPEPVQPRFLFPLPLEAGALDGPPRVWVVLSRESREKAAALRLGAARTHPKATTVWERNPRVFLYER